MKRGKDGFYCRYVKRILDIVCALVAIITFWWLYVIISVLVRVKLGSPILFKQKRPGLNEKIFTIYKFRTMTDKKDKNGNFLPDDVRLTKFGKFLRSTSLDELPEAWNILKGDMSVVGPRPLLIEYLTLYNDYQKRRHDVKPGLSGWAQINGRNTLSWEDKFICDVWYVDNVSFKFDIEIIIKTVIKSIKRDGISSGTSVTMEAFRGTVNGEMK